MFTYVKAKNFKSLKNISFNLNKTKNETNKLKATIIKIPHHGSKTSSTMDFIEKVKPQEALIGVGKKNKFGHPAITTIQTLQNQNIKI